MFGSVVLDTRPMDLMDMILNLHSHIKVFILAAIFQPVRLVFQFEVASAKEP